MQLRITQLGSIVQIFPDSDAADFYVNGIERQLSGQPASGSTDRVREANGMAEMLTQMKALAALKESAKYAIVGPKGGFACSGLLPGRYLLLATVLGAPNNALAAKLVQSYWRADVTIPAPNRRRAYLIFGFRLLGQAPAF